MKKTLLTTLALVAGTLLSNAQGTIGMANLNTVTYLMETNGAQYVPGTVIATTGLATARTLSTVNSFFYEILTTTAGGRTGGLAPSASATSLNPFDASWLDTGIGGKNTTLARGGVTGVGGPATAAGTWAAPTGADYTTATSQWFMLVGWSANLGTTWAEAKANYGTGTATGWFGQSALGWKVSGGGPNSLATPNVFGASSAYAAGNGLPSGFALGIVTPAVVPEPATFALAGLGIAAMLVSRRRK